MLLNTILPASIPELIWQEGFIPLKNLWVQAQNPYFVPSSPAKLASLTFNSVTNFRVHLSKLSNISKVCINFHRTVRLLQPSGSHSFQLTLRISSIIRLHTPFLLLHIILYILQSP